MHFSILNQRYHPLARRLIARVDNTVIRVSAEWVPAPLYFLIQVPLSLGTSTRRTGSGGLVTPSAC